MDTSRGATLLVPPSLWFFLPPRQRGPELEVRVDGTSTAGHLLSAAGVPRTEVGGLLLDGHRVEPGYRPRAGDRISVLPIATPQPAPTSPPRFVLDVHLGSLARRMRLLGLDTSYDRDADDEALLERSLTQRRVLLTGTAGCCTAVPCAGAPTSTIRCPTSSCARCWTGSHRRCARGPGARPATACCEGWPRARSRTGCRPAPGSGTSASAPARRVGRCTGAARTAAGCTTSWRPAQGRARRVPTTRFDRSAARVPVGGPAPRLRGCRWTEVAGRGRRAGANAGWTASPTTSVTTSGQH